MAAIVDGVGPVPAGAAAASAAVDGRAASRNDSGSSKSREEGEISHSNSRESGSASEHDCADSAQIGSARPSPKARTGQEAKEGKYGTVLSSSKVGVSSRASPHGKNVKGSEKTRGFVPFLIGFSDDDSGSDSEDSKQTSRSAEVNKLEGVGRLGPSSHQGANRVSRQPVPSQIGSKKGQQELTKKAKPIYNEFSHNRPIVSTSARINVPTPRSAVQNSGLRNISSLQGRAVQNQIPGQKFNLDYNMQQVHDLRELIAIRESEVVKGAQQAKNSVGELCGDSNFKSPESHLKRPRPASTYDRKSEINESNKKRLKTGELPPPPPLRLKTGELPPPRLKTGKLPSPPGRSGSMDRCRKVVAPLDDCDNNQSLLVNGEGGKQAEIQHTLSGNSALAIVQRSGNSEGVNHTEIAIQDFPKKSDNVELDHPQYNGREVQKSVQNMGESGANLLETLDRNPMNTRKHLSNVRDPASPQNALKVNQQDAPLSNPDFFSDLTKRNLMVNSNTDLQSLLDYEELLDKEIDEAQEHRRKCEVEEKNALMAYRKAQRVLIDAHARCSQIYSKRELYSAQLRSYMMENPNLFSSQREAGLISSNTASDLQLMPSSCNQVLGESNVVDHGGHAADIPSANNEYQNMPNLHASETNLETDACRVPDGSPSKDSKQSFSSDACSSSGGLSQSSYEDIEEFELNHKSAQKNIVYEGMSEVDEGREKDIYEESERQGPVGSSQDCLLLEATLRAQLFEKMKGKGLLRRSKSADNLVEKGTNSDNDIMDTDVEDTVLHEARNDRHLEIDGTSQVLESCDRHLETEEGSQEGRSSALPTQINCQSGIPNPDESPTKVSMDCCVSLDFEQPTVSGAILFPALKNTFINPKVMKLIGVLESKSTSPGLPFSPSDEENEYGGSFNKSKLCIESLGTTKSAAMDFYLEKNGSFSSGFTIDPVWPLCMYELRGKCNSDECKWQHARDYSSANSGKQHLSSDALLKKRDNFFLSPPTYVVGKDILRADSCAHIAASPQGYGQCWRKSFSTFLVLSYLCPTILPSNEPFLYGSEARIEDDSSWNRRLSDFQSGNGTLSQLDQCTSGVEQSVEMALLKLSEDVNKRISRLEAVKVLARAIEDNASSAVLWIVYLLIFYSNQNPTAMNDFFKHAVKYNRESYDLWLLCINSRVQLDDQLAEYDTALSDICYHASKSDVDTLHVSQCILDIFLQMINCLCVSGNVDRAIEKIYGLHSSSEKSGDHPHLSMTNIVACLTICDKVIFWICCVYLFVYKKLPDLVVERLECRKEPSAIEWPSAYLKPDEKQQAGSLMKIAVDSLKPYLNHESLENENNLRAAHLFALNHVRCVLVLEGLECSGNLLEKYIKLYPSCPELVLMSARTEYELGGSSFYGFEEALRTWPNEVGVQCIWNQYARLALRSGKVDFVKELMQRWLNSVSEAQDSEVGVSDTKEQSSDRSLQSASVTDLHDRFFKCGQNDQVFGMLNLSLYKLLQNDQAEARRASELALKAATVDHFHLCLKELVPFWLTDGVRQHEGDFNLKGILDIINDHAAETRSLLVSEPLSRVFIKKIKKTRVQQLLNKLLSPVSADFSLMHMVCEVWHALSILPNFFSKPTDLVDYAEAMMEILPSNYLFAMLVCKELCKFSHATLPSSLSFWAGSLLVNALYQAVPIAPEYVWVEAAEVLGNLTDIRGIKESFLKKALAVYPFSMKLWTSRLHLSDSELHVELVKEAAKKIGIELA